MFQTTFFIALRFRIESGLFLLLLLPNCSTCIGFVRQTNQSTL